MNRSTIEVHEERRILRGSLTPTVFSLRSTGGEGMGLASAESRSETLDIGVVVNGTEPTIASDEIGVCVTVGICDVTNAAFIIDAS